MDSPPPKRIRKSACPCLASGGSERDYRTIQKHLRAMHTNNGLTFPISITSAYEDTLMLPPSSSTCAMCTSHSTSGSSSTQSSSTSTSRVVLNASITEEQVYQYIMKETLVKLDRGHSQSEIEAHLRSTNQLLGKEVLPNTWSEVLQIMHRLGYKSPRHYKVCCASDHSYLLKDSSDSCAVCGKK